MLSTYWLTNLAVLSFEVASDLKLSFIKLTFLLSYFFVKKIPLSWRVEYVTDGSVDQSVSEWEMYVCHTNQIGSTINSQSNFLLKVNGMWEDSIPTQFRTAIFILLWKRRKYIFPHFLWVILRILVMDELSLEVWDSAWACCMQMELDIFIFSYKGNMILLFFTRSKFN